ncbi:dihydrofolate reductase [Cytobacillus oceanisediminis]|uniref:dihydrofolate reductase n=1 Tax=Cytobacillus oceanisediminis TaxID=665099 RepID=UPI001FB31B88|nr:dihydrofolate reductase [Cytobacillus oceanisediminis]UOE58177.1 dihydrofolate reductase [Cytobacillus oceanisediminis]
MISMIVAADSNNAIGYENKLLCRLKDDMKHFVRTTTGKPIIMGSNTFESLGKKPLKDRFNIVLTNSPMGLTIEHLDTIDQYENLMFEDFEFIQFMVNQSPEKEFVVIGGQKTYELFLPFASRIYLTRIHHKFENADTFFPELSLDDWFIKEFHGSGLKNEDNDQFFSLYTLERTGRNATKMQSL